MQINNTKDALLSSWFIASKAMPVGEAVDQSYQQRSHKNNIHLVVHLRRSVQDAFKSTNELPWSPMA